MQYILAPMEAVNCASFRVLCKRRGADIVYTDMIDADIFCEYADKNSIETAITHFINPQKDEQPLVVQIGGRNVENLKRLCSAVESFAYEININLGCPLGYMLGKKGGAYLLKHTDQLYPFLKELRAHIKGKFTIKIRSGWDSEHITAKEVAQEAEKIGIDALIIHPRTKEQRYRDRADWILVKEIKKLVSIPVILSGDVFNSDLAEKAIRATNCDGIMIGRGAQVNPSIFSQVDREMQPSTKQFHKFEVDPVADFNEWLALYKEREHRYNISEIRDHAIWTSTECQGAKEVKQELLNATTEEQIVAIINSIVFKP